MDVEPQLNSEDEPIFTCCWRSCTEIYHTIPDLDQHLRDHLENEDLKVFCNCQWGCCEASFNCVADLRRHVYYHGYHMCLLIIGQDECRQSCIKNCTRSEKNGHILPQLLHDYECLWSNCRRTFESNVEFHEHVSKHASINGDKLKTSDEPKALCSWQGCNKLFITKYRLVEHARMHSNQKLLGCFQCGELFRTKSTLFEHCWRQEANNRKVIKPRIVTRPSQKFPRRRKIKLEKLNAAEFTCCWRKCTQKFNTIMNLNQHLQDHLETDEFKVLCKCQWDSCEFTSSRLPDLRRHVYYHAYHTCLLKIGREECQKAAVPVCSHSEENRNVLPELDQDFECMWLNCKRTFESIIEFQDHIAKHSSFDYDMLKTPEENLPKARCNWQYCKKTFINKYRLVEHTRMHSNQKLLGCFQCGELFRTKTTLFDHCRRQEVNNTHKYQCGQCFKFYATEKLLRNHVVIHVNCFKCSMCDMTCNSSNSLATHIRYRHLKDRPISCPECQYTCVTKSDLAKHKRHVHSKVMQRCGETGCNYTVKTYSSLRRHYLEVHANSPFIYLCHCCDKLFKYGKLLSKHLIAKHNFQLPSGHKRFTYRIDENGFYSLETTRIESLEVTRQILSPVLFEVSELTQDSSNYEIISIANGEDQKPFINDEAEPLKKVVITVDGED